MSRDSPASKVIASADGFLIPVGELELGLYDENNFSDPPSLVSSSYEMFFHQRWNGRSVKMTAHLSVMSRYKTCAWWRGTLIRHRGNSTFTSLWSSFAVRRRIMCIVTIIIESCMIIQILPYIRSSSEWNEILPCDIHTPKRGNAQRLK